MIQIGEGVELWMHCEGEGRPSVILEGPGPGVDSRIWGVIQARLACTTQTCRYDRAGTGMSTGTEPHASLIGPRAQDLERLLEAAPIQQPYVMAGYSLGGAIVLRYALQHPERMAGLVLIESAAESILVRRTGEAELAPWGETPLGDLPLVVMTVDTQEYILPPIPDTSPEQAMKIWQAAQAQMAALSERGRQVFVKDTNHYALLETHEQQVIQAITVVVQEARQKAVA